MQGLIWDYNTRKAMVVEFLDPSAPEKLDKGVIGCFHFEPVMVYITKDCCDEQALHYGSKNITEFSKGQEVSIDGIMRNFYGKYYRVVAKGRHYDVKIENITFKQIQKKW